MASKTMTGSGDAKAAREAFHTQFESEVQAIEQQISRFSGTALVGGERNDAIDHCFSSVSRLNNGVRGISSNLPSYDQRTYSDTIKSLTARLEDLRASHAPKPKFAFSNARKNPSAISLTEAANRASNERVRTFGYGGSSAATSTAASSIPATPGTAQTPPSILDPADTVDITTTIAAAASSASSDDDMPTEAPTYDRDRPHALSADRIRKPSFSTHDRVVISQEEAAHIILPVSAAHATGAGTVSHLRRCAVDMSVPTAGGHAFAGLTLRRAQASLLVCGRVDGPAHATGLRGCVVVVACRQWRMHDCQDCVVYLACASRPVVEDCARVSFAELPRYYATDDMPPNNWQEVDDFKWLKSTPSPNWRLLPRNEYVDERVWANVVPGGPGHGLAEILTAVGVQDN